MAEKERGARAERGAGTDPWPYRQGEVLTKFVSWLTDSEVKDEKAAHKILRNRPFTTTDLRKMAYEGFANLWEMANRGDRKANVYLCDRFFGTPDKPFQEQVAAIKDEAEANAQMWDLLIESGYSEAETKAFIERTGEVPVER